MIARALALLAMLLAVSPAAAAEIGQAQSVVNQVHGGGLLYRITQGKAVSTNEQVNTGADSAARLAFIDGSRLELGANAEIRLDKLVYDPARGPFSGDIHLSRGLLRLVGGPNPKDLRIVTPTMAIGVRGTRLAVLVGPQGSEVTILDGTVIVTIGAERLTLSTGQTLLIGPRGRQSGQPSPALRQALAHLDRLLPVAAPARTHAPTDLLRPQGNRVVHPDGRIDALDRNNRLLGRYDPVRNQTFDPQGRLIGPGNLLPQLWEKAP